MERKGSGGRPRYGDPSKELAVRLNLVISADLKRRLQQYCNDEERAMSWVIGKATEKWLEEKGY